MVLVLNLRCLDEAIGHGFYGKPPPAEKLDIGYLYCTQGLHWQWLGLLHFLLFLKTILVWMPPFSLSNPWVSELPDTVGAHGSFGLPKKHPPSPAPPIWQPEYHKAYCTLKRGSRKSYMAKIWRSPSSSTFYGQFFVGWWIKTPPSTYCWQRNLNEVQSTSSISPIRPIWKSRLLSRFFFAGWSMFQVPQISIHVHRCFSRRLAEVDYIRWRHLDLGRPHPVWFKLGHEGQQRAPTQIVRIGDVYFSHCKPPGFFGMTQWMGSGPQSGRNIRFPTKKPGITRPCSISPWPMISTSPGGQDYHCVCTRLD